MTSSVRTLSEVEFQRILYLARVIPLRIQPAEVRRREVAVREGEADRVGEIERLGPEFQAEPFGQPEILEDREVNLALRGPGHRSAIAAERRQIRLSDGRRLWRVGECRRVI